MPQIWPMNWIILYSLFVLVFMTFMMFMYFTPLMPSFEDGQSEVSTPKFNWKW